MQVIFHREIPLYQMYTGLIIKATIARVPPISLWILQTIGPLEVEVICSGFWLSFSCLGQKGFGQTLISPKKSKSLEGNDE